MFHYTYPTMASLCSLHTRDDLKKVIFPKEML